MARSVYSAHHSHQYQREAFFNLRHYRTLSNRNHTNGSRFISSYTRTNIVVTVDVGDGVADGPIVVWMAWRRRWCRITARRRNKKQKKIFVLFQRRIPPSILCSSYTFFCLLFVDKYFFPSGHVAVALFTRCKKQVTVKSRTDYDLSKLLTKMLFRFSNKLIGKYVRKYSFEATDWKKRFLIYIFIAAA